MVMTATTFNLKKNDRLPTFPRTLTDSTDTAVDVSGGAVTFIMKTLGGVVKIDRVACSFDSDGSDGKVIYSWAAGDTDTAEQYNAEWEFTDANGLLRSFPLTGYDRVWIRDDLA